MPAGKVDVLLCLSISFSRLNVKFWQSMASCLTNIFKSGLLVFSGGIKTCNLIKKETLAQFFSCEFCEIFKSTFFIEHLRWLLCNLFRANFPPYSQPENNCFRILESTEVKGLRTVQIDYAVVCRTNF